MKKAFITGISGQTGSYLAEFLLKQDYEVHGLIRRTSLIKTDRIDNIFDKIQCHYGDLTDGLNLYSVIKRIQPTEIYNLAAQSHVKVSFETPEYTANTDALGTLRLLEIIKNLDNKIKFYQASTSELFGDTPSPQNEKSELIPQSPYAAAKLYSYWLTRNYRDAYGLFATNGILFNHEGPRRGETFVTRKITKWAANWKVNNTDLPLELGNVYAIRDWSDARDMVSGIFSIMQHHKPEDFVLGSAIGRTVLDFVTESFAYVGMDFEWNEKLGLGIDKKTNKVVLKINSRYFRPLEVKKLIADPKKAVKELNWKPKISFKDMVKQMIDNDITIIKKNNYSNLLK